MRPVIKLLKLGGKDLLNWRKHEQRKIGDLVYGHYVDLATAKFDGNTEAEVKGKIEAWAKEMITRVDAAIRREFI
jgi:hypothetical protein